MRIAILGAGRMGGTLGQLWAAAGHDVVFSYSRDAERLDRRAAEWGRRAAHPAEAVTGADAVLLAVHWSRVEDALAQAGDLAGKVVMNCCVPLNDSDSALVVGTTDSGAEALARMRPEARWVACFNTSPSESLAPVFARKAEAPRPHMLTYGDDWPAKEAARALIRDIGFEPLEAGGLTTARYVEPFAMVTAVLAYGQPGGPALTYRFEKLDEERQR